MSVPPADTPRRQSRRETVWLAVASFVAVLAVVVAAAWVLLPPPAPAAAPAPTPTPTATVTPAASPTPTPTPTGFPANTAAYTLEGLPEIDVFALVPALPVDPDPFGALTGELARAVPAWIPVFGDPAAEPVAALPRDHPYDGTTLPVIERQEHWVHVLLTGRAAVPSQGSSAQLSGWLRLQDVELTRIAATVEVDIAARTIDIAHLDGTRERIATDFGWGTSSTPTPLGRSFVMMVRTEPSFTYTRGHPLIYLSSQSPTLDGFGGAAAAVTAFHYHDARSGSISNGCLRVAPETVERLAQLPVGTPVYVR